MCLLDKIKLTYCDFVFGKLKERRFRLLKEKDYQGAVLIWMRDCLRLIRFAPEERKELYYRGLGGRGCLQKN